MTATPRIRGLSLRTKVFALVATVTMAAVAAATLSGAMLLRTDRLAYVNDIGYTMAEKLATQTRGVVASLASRLRLYAGLAGGPDGAALRARATAELLAGDPDLVRVRLYARKGADAVLLLEQSSPPTLARADLAEADLVDLDAATPIPDASRELLLLNRSVAPATPLLTAVVPVGQDLVVVADWLPQELIRLYTRNPAYQAFLVGADGGLVVHPDAALVVQRRNMDLFDPVHAALDGGVGRRGTRGFVDTDGVRQIGAFAPAELGGLTVVSYLPERRALAAGEQLVRVSLLIAAALLVVSLVVAYLFAGRLTRPIWQLSQGTARLAAGDFDLALEAGSGDELAGLAQDFVVMARKLKALNAQVVQSTKLALLGQLGAGLTHEVKNPLGAILGFTELARDEADDPERVREYTGIILTATQRALGIISRVLVYARPGTEERTRLQPEAFVREAVALVRHQVQMARVQLVEEIPDGLPPVVGNAGQLEQVLINLLMNARDATPAGGQVKVTASADAARVVLRVADTGSGMPAHVRERLFEPFFSTKEPGKGTGLGLSVSLSIVESHGGRMSVDSEPGRGSTFEISLPRADLGPGAAAAPPPTDR